MSITLEEFITDYVRTREPSCLDNKEFAPFAFKMLENSQLPAMAVAAAAWCKMHGYKYDYARYKLTAWLLETPTLQYTPELLVDKLHKLFDVPAAYIRQLNLVNIVDRMNKPHSWLRYTDAAQILALLDVAYIDLIR